MRCDLAAAVAADAGWRIVATAGELSKHGDAAAGIEEADLRRRPTSTSAWCSAATARSSTRCAASPAPASRSSASTSAPSASSPRSSARRPRRGSAAPSPGETETIELPGLEVELDGALRRPQRHQLQPPPARPGRRAQLQDRRRGGRARPLRRARRLDAGRLDRLQPRQPGPDPGLGGEGLRGQLHLAPLADGAGAGRRALRRPPRRQRRRARRRSKSPSTAIRSGRSSRAPRSRSASSTTSPASRSCRARASTTASARSSATSPSEAAPVAH